MNRPAAVKLPALDFSSARSLKNHKVGARGASLVKVEQIGNRSVEEVIDRDVYLNINADWVNAKGSRKVVKKPSQPSYIANRSMDDSCCTHPFRQSYNRHSARDDSTNELDASKSSISSSACCFSPQKSLLLTLYQSFLTSCSIG